ncbi:Fungal trans, partial [Geosmithia morbida]
RKIKCNGQAPCDFCARGKASCTFNSSYTRGRHHTIVPSSVHGGTDDTPVPEVLVEDAPIDQDVLATDLQNRRITPTRLTAANSDYLHLVSSSRASPEPSSIDPQGHYVGPASGTAFLIRVQKRLHQVISFSSASTIFTFGDAPLQLPEFDPSFCMMLPRDDAQRLIDRYFDFAMPTYRFLHRPTLQEWFVEFYDTLGVMRDAHSAPAKIALLFMVFAHARVYMPEVDRLGPEDMSTRYYLAAEHQLTKERGSVRLSSVQARLTQCYYLLAQSRINQCWSQFGTVRNLALAIGLNRNRRFDGTGGVTMIEIECRRRTFWCAYTLDAYLSVALGRPRSFHDDDIDTPLPAQVDDDQITVDRIAASIRGRNPSTMVASLAHIQLARIISKIVRDLYSIRPISTSRRVILTERISKDLSDWQVDFSQFLDVRFFFKTSPSIIVPIFQRQQNVLNLTYWHCIILTHRPFVLHNLTRLLRNPQPGSGQDVNDPQTEESVQQCLMAAMKTVHTVDRITQNQKMFRAFWITAYFAFTATIVLYIYVIQKKDSPPEVYSSYLAAAIQCQSHISSVAEKGSLLERYGFVLEELRVEAVRQTSAATSVATDDSPNLVTNYTDSSGANMVDFNGMPNYVFTDTYGWGQFASMVSSGLGNLDSFLRDDLFQP